MRASLILVGAGLGLIAAFACSAGGDDTIGGGGNGNGNGGASGTGFNLGGTGNIPIITCQTDCPDFPAAPIIDPGAPANAPDMFGDPENFTSPGPCVVEPSLGDGTQPGALFPFNWLRPRFRWTPAAGETLFEVRVTAPNQANPLRAYTTATQWAIPREIWEAVRNNSNGMDLTVTIRGIAGSGTPTGTRGTFTIAPVAAEGTMVYWATNSSEVSPTASKLVGFKVGDEGVIDALTVPQVKWTGIIAQDGGVLRGYWSDTNGVPSPGGISHGVPIGNVECIGCHTSTPDGDAVGFTDGWPWDTVIASVKEGEAGNIPGYVSPGAKFLMYQPWQGTTTFSKAHWNDNERLMITSWMARNITDTGQPNGALQAGFYGASDAPNCPLNAGTKSYNPYLINPQHNEILAWYDLKTTWMPPAWSQDPAYGQTQLQALNNGVNAALAQGAFGFISLQGETGHASNPVWSHDGNKILYSSSPYTQDGHPGGGLPGQAATNNVDLKMVDYNNHTGGPVSAVPGAADPNVAEYYPSLSDDDKLVAFNRSGINSGVYYRPDGEIVVTPLDASQPPLRLAANDPPACAGQPSPGVLNSWAKWAPAHASANGKTYYFLIFSSARQYPGQFQIPAAVTSLCVQNLATDRRSSQLYITAVVRDDATGALTSYGSIYLWNQDPTWSNLTPAWDVFQIPPVPLPK